MFAPNSLPPVVRKRNEKDKSDVSFGDPCSIRLPRIIHHAPSTAETLVFCVQITLGASRSAEDEFLSQSAPAGRRRTQIASAGVLRWGALDWEPGAGQRAARLRLSGGGWPGG